MSKKTLLKKIFFVHNYELFGSKKIMPLSEVAREVIQLSDLLQAIREFEEDIKELKKGVKKKVELPKKVNIELSKDFEQGIECGLDVALEKFKEKFGDET